MTAEIIKELDKILPVVVRVHGENHSELEKVAKLYAQLKENPTQEVFEQLRQVTNNYQAPADACPTFNKTYADLKELDK